MKIWNFSERRCPSGLSICLILVTITIIGSPAAFGHGGKKHAEGSFTQLQALQKAVKLYDRLIQGGKLKESWETGLKQVDISIRKKNGNKEFVVLFKRSEGNSDKVYFFFKADGKYAGSNFTGK
jgi:hypothetical protein